MSPATGPVSATSTADSRCQQTLHAALEQLGEEVAASATQTGNETGISGWPQEIGPARNRLLGANEPELVLVGLLLMPPTGWPDDAPTRQVTWRDFSTSALHSGSPILAWHALRACHHDLEAGCPDLEQALLIADRQNAESWVLAATARYRRGDRAGAFTAMQASARAPTATWYWPETIALIERALATETALPFPERALGAIGAAAGMALPAQSALLNMCRTESATDRAWAETCLALGTLRGEEADTELAHSISWSLREATLQAMGETARAAEVAAQREAFLNDPARPGTRNRLASELTSQLILTDPARFQAYLHAMQQAGETEGADAFFRREMPLFLERGGWYDREEAGACVAQLLQTPED